ncbi:leucine-rich repeat protein kinase family protein [Actinidia rufa]|uniref:Leucine-rich repeat protein kinase family protein n=1 Tax=Actinidia rufa TaxID=165716 RepID=A0A7J0FMP4_9ERIC|nr:leucine-rich repeat protein kinase family protein [Actinidia rufa]
MWNWKCCLLLLCLLLCFQNLINPAISLSSEGLSLLSLKSAVDSNSAAFPDWNEDDPTPCHWTGITCTNITGVIDPRVVGVSLAGKNLRGYIPSELGTLVYLRRLNLHGNNFYGSVPDQLFNASSLHSLFLYSNNLSGYLPPSLCNLPRLQNLDLSNNSIAGCPAIFRLGFGREMPNLVQLDLSANDLTGSVPEDIGELKSLSGTLNLSFNHLSGPIPKSMGDLPMTVSFDLRNNNFTGEIPQTGSFGNQGPTAFLNNPALCGFPLKKQCENGSETAPANQYLSPESDSNGHNNPRKGLKPGLIILISVADAVGVSLVGLVIVYAYWKKKDSHSCSCTGKGKFGGNEKSKLWVCPCIGGFRNNDSEVDSEKGGGGGGGSSSGVGGEGDLVAIDKGFNFELDELLRASAYVLGKSGLGIVYKVVLGNGVPVAVRRLGEGGEQRYKEFVAEIQAIARVKHPNIVRLRAYYWAPDEKLLISDFISNGNLASALRGNNPSSSGGFIGGALPYVKSVQPERANNYRAPEARISGNRPTQKWDVYSFGVVLLELLTGKSPELSPPTTSTSTEVQDLVRWVRKGFEEENPLSDMVDPMLLQEVHAKKEVLAVFHIAIACTEGDPEVRPRMKTVLENLERIGT